MTIRTTPRGSVLACGVAGLAHFTAELRRGRPPIRIVMASGHFNPLHAGHVRYLRAASSLGDCLVVVVNSDFQVGLKGSFPFMPEGERAEVVAGVWGVHAVVVAEDRDRTVRRAVEAALPCVFANGGDVVSADQLEAEVCRRLGVAMVFGVGGTDKFQSSSRLIAGARKCVAGPGPGGV